MRLVVLLLALLLPACSMMQPNTDMTASQIKELVKDKTGSVVCATVMGPWGTGKTVVVTLDQSVIKDGGVAVDANCLVNITTQTPPRAPVIVQPAPLPAKEPAK